jgi:hypothetical protein
MKMKMTKAEKKQLNACARMLYLSHGYVVEIGYDFSVATHPQEKGMWNMAILTKQFWQDHFLGNCVNIGDLI